MRDRIYKWACVCMAVPTAITMFQFGTYMLRPPPVERPETYSVWTMCMRHNDGSEPERCLLQIRRMTTDRCWDYAYVEWHSNVWTMTPNITGEFCYPPRVPGEVD